MEILILLAVLLALCGAVGWVSQERGRSFALGFWLSFFLTPLFGLLILLALPAESAGASGRQRSGRESADPAIVVEEWTKTSVSLDATDYDDFAKVFPGTKAALIALKQKRMLEAWLAIDRTDGEAIERLLQAPVFPALSAEIRRTLEQETDPSVSVSNLLDRLRADEKSAIDKLERARIAEQVRASEARAEKERQALAHSEKINGQIKQFGRWVLATLLVVATGSIGYFSYRKMVAPGQIAPVIAAVENNMIEVPGGAFIMGSSDDEVGHQGDESPQRTVTIEYRFAVGKYEVTWTEYSACIADGVCATPLDDGFGKGSRPVTNVSWKDAKTYTSWLSRKTGDPYRLLTEAEWEYAARGGTQSRWGFGDDEELMDSYAWYWSNSGQQSRSVGIKAANGFGLHDMHGNVWEWVEDCYQSDYRVQASDGSAYESEDFCAHRVSRGGSFDNYSLSLRSAYRLKNLPADKRNSVGFRVARTL